MRHIVCPKSADPPRSPLLKRVQSEEKLSSSYTGEKKHLCPRKHSLEVTQEEVQDEERGHNVLQSVDETSSEHLAVHRVRPVEQGCLKRPGSRKVGRQESVEELDKDKLKFKIVVRRKDWTERRESLQKQDALHDSDSLPHADERQEGFWFPVQNKTPSSPESGSLETKATNTTFKDVLYKKLSARVSEAGSEPSSGSCESDGAMRSASCSVSTERQHSRLSKDGMNLDRPDFKAPNIEFTRKRLSFEEREDCMCRLPSGLHENLHFGSMRSKSLQLDTDVSHDHKGSLHLSPEGLPPKLFSGRGESAVEKLQLISAEAPLRKTSSEYKLEGRHVSLLKPLEGTLDIGLLSGPRVSKTETCLSKMIDNTSNAVSVSPSIRLKSPTEKQITIPHLKSADKMRSLTCSLSSEAASLNSADVPKEQSANAAIDLQMSGGGKKTQDKHREPLKASMETFTVKQESRPGAKASSSLVHRHSSQFSAGKTPSIREVSNEDQEDEAEQQEVALDTAQNSNKMSLISADLEVNSKTCGQEETPAAAGVVIPAPLRPSTSSGLDTGQPDSCGERKADVPNTNRISGPEVTAAPQDVLYKQKPLVTRAPASVASSSSSSSTEPDYKSRSSKVKVCYEPWTAPAVKVAGTDSSASEINTRAAELQQNKEVCAVNTSSSLNFTAKDETNVNKNDSTVTNAWQENKVPVLSHDAEVVNDCKQLSKEYPSEKSLQQSSESGCKKNNAVVVSAKGKGSASGALDEYTSSSRSKSRPGPPMTVKEVKLQEVTSHSTAPPGLEKKWSLNSTDSAAAPSMHQAAHEAKHEDVLLSPGGEVQPELVQSSSPTTRGDAKKRASPSKSSATIKDNTDSKLNPPACATKQGLDVKPKNHAPKTHEQSDSNPRGAPPLAAPQLQQLREDQRPDVSAPPGPLLVPLKPAMNKDAHSPSSGATSGQPSLCESVDTASKEPLKLERHKIPGSQAPPPSSQPSCSRKEQADGKKRDAVQETTSTQKTVKKDSPRASPSAPKDSSSRDSSRSKKQQESPRRSGSKK